MSSSYRFQQPTSTGPQGGTLLPKGDYPFVVVACDPPHINPKSGNYVCAVELSIQPDGQKVFANPWAGKTAMGEQRDQIAEFLLAINRAPKLGDEPNWQGCVGAKGKARLKVEDDLNGVPRNKVAFFHTPKQANATYPAQSTNASINAFEQARQQTAVSAGAPNNDVAPDDIPF